MLSAVRAASAGARSVGCPDDCIADTRGDPVVMQAFIRCFIIFHPQVANACQVARMVQHKVQKPLLHQLVAVALHDGTLGHALQVGKRIIRLRLSSLSSLDGCIERAVLAVQVGVCLLARLFVKTAQRDVILIHGANMVVGVFRHHAGFIQLGKYGIAYVLGAFP